MEQPISVNDRFAVGRDQPRPGEIGDLASRGFKSLVNLRPAGEEGQTMPPEQEAAEARAAGLRYVHLPVRADTLSEQTVDEFRKTVADLPAPVFVHCASGKRSGAFTMMHVGLESGMSGQEVVDRAQQMGFRCDTPELKEFVKDYVDERQHPSPVENGAMKEVTMQFDQFLGQVQSRAHLDSRESALKATRATLATLAQRLGGGEPENLAAQLPSEIARFLQVPEHGERFSSDEFFQRVSERTGADLPDAVFQARAVLAVLGEAVSRGGMDDLRSQLPPDYQRIFDSGSQGPMRGH